MQIIQLFERRPEASSIMHQRMAKYHGQDDIYISMVQIPKIGINPQTRHDTGPIGVYTYQLTNTIYDQLVNDKLPYASQQKFVAILKGDNSGQVRSGDTATINKIISDIPQPSENSLRAVGLAPEERWAEHPMQTLLTKSAAMVLDMTGEKFMTTRGTVKWNSVLRSFGIQSLRDDGTGSIYDLEPTQTVFLTTKPITIVDLVRNKSELFHREITTMRQYLFWANKIPNRQLADWVDHTITVGEIPHDDNGGLGSKFPMMISKDMRFDRRDIKSLLSSRDVEPTEDIYDWLQGDKLAFYDHVNLNPHNQNWFD